MLILDTFDILKEPDTYWTEQQLVCAGRLVP